MKRLGFITILLLLSGCTETIYLKNMDGMVATCGPYPAAGASGVIGAVRENQCITDYQRQGYERVPH